MPDLEELDRAEAARDEVEHGPAPSLMNAILAAQAAAPTLPKDKVNPHFGSRFTGLETVTETIGPILREQGLVWLTLPGRDAQGNPVLHYQLVLARTGEAVGGAMGLLLSKGDMQGLGSAITYARRYALCAILGLVGDEDDDGNAAVSGGAAAVPFDDGETVNLQQQAKGLRNEAINQAFAKVGLPAQEKPWGQLGRVPADRADGLRDALQQLQEMA